MWMTPACPLDNNPAEQAFDLSPWDERTGVYGTKRRRAAAVYMTLLATCRRAKVNPFDYLQDILDASWRIPPATS